MPQSSHLIGSTLSISYIVFGCAKNVQLYYTTPPLNESISYSIVISIRSEEVSETFIVNTGILSYPRSKDGYQPLVIQWSLPGRFFVVISCSRGYLGLIVTLTAYGMYAGPPIAFTKRYMDVELRATYSQIGVVGTYASYMNVL